MFRGVVAICYRCYYNMLFIILWFWTRVLSCSVFGRTLILSRSRTRNTETNAHSVCMNLLTYATQMFCMWRMEINDSPRGCHAKILLTRTRLFHSLPLAPKTNELCRRTWQFYSENGLIYNTHDAHTHIHTQTDIFQPHALARRPAVIFSTIFYSADENIPTLVFAFELYTPYHTPQPNLVTSPHHARKAYVPKTITYTLSMF